jgi:hypothetical protein
MRTARVNRWRSACRRETTAAYRVLPHVCHLATVPLFVVAFGACMATGPQTTKVAVHRPSGAGVEVLKQPPDSPMVQPVLSPSAASDSGAAEPACTKAPIGRYGTWTPTSADVLRVINQVDESCGSQPWRPTAVDACMREQAQFNVTVAGVIVGRMDGEPSRAAACDLSLSSAEWKGRRFIVARTGVSSGPTVIGWNHVFEMTKGTPVRYLTNDPRCQDFPGVPFSRPVPPGWDSLPEDLQYVLCWE